MICFRRISSKLYKGHLSKTDIHLGRISDKPKSEVQVVIVGAGLAGLSAASHLIKNGFKRTVILEATERYGGRVNSKLFGDTFCELGAKWIPIDASQGSVYELFLQAGLEQKKQEKEDTVYINSVGTEVDRNMSEVVKILYQKLLGSIKLKEKYIAGDMQALNSVHTYFQSEIANLLNSTFDAREQALASDIFNCLIKEFSGILGCCLEYLNIQHVANMQLKTMGSPIYIPTGFNDLLQRIAKEIDEEHMKIGKPVGLIHWYSPTKLDNKTVSCMDGSSFVADHIICTLPLGVLKNFCGYMFKPLLPRDKLRAIKNLGFGSPVKIYFEYDKQIKPWFRSNLRPLWSSEERSKDLKWTKQVVEISKVPKSKRVLEITIGGAFYDEIEKLPDTEVLTEVTKILRKCLKNEEIPYPKSVLRSNWSSSACYLGGRPYFSVDSTTKDVLSLATPLGQEPCLLFAGDATILNGFGTVNGARMSGIREAQRIVEYYDKPN